MTQVMSFRINGFDFENVNIEGKGMKYNIICHTISGKK